MPRIDDIVAYYIGKQSCWSQYTVAILAVQYLLRQKIDLAKVFTSRVHRQTQAELVVVYLKDP